MSFILDALKKSESDRQRQTGPALFEVKIAPPKSRFPIWAVALAVLLGVNAAIGAWYLLRHPSGAEGTSAAVVSAAASAAPQSAAAADQVSTTGPAGAGGPAPTPPPGPAPTSAVAASPAPAVEASSTAPPPPLHQSAASAATTASTGSSAPSATAPNSPASGSVAAGSSAAIGAGGRGEPTLAASGQTPASLAGQEPTANPDDYAPAKEPSPGQGLANHVKVGTSSGYILYQDAAVVPGANIPALRLDLHVYAAKPEDRFALVNMQKVREGDTLPQGVRVEAIIPDGVVMSHHGMKFLLPRQ
ncbi:MAG TPA: general secretion pathway protein GspB [Steroidobacteraceae bacterium]|jgi:general secretion pathway protein B